jgi:uncharacterized protein
MSTPDFTSTTPYTSRADVTTDVPGRYAKQLVSHLGRKLDFVEDQGSWTATVVGSVARITVGDGVLVLQAEAPDVESLARVEHGLGSHLERFGQRHGLTVTWQRSTTPPA